MSKKKITMDYDEYLEWQEKNEKYIDLVQAFKDKNKCLYIYDAWISLCDPIEIVSIPDAVKETIKNMSIKQFKKLKKEIL